MMKKMFRLAAAAVVAVTCAGMWGCGDWFEPDTHYEWDRSRHGKKVVGFLNDSLVIVSDYRFWREVRGDNDDEVANGFGHQALYLYNYRVQENGPRWMDSLDNGIRNDDFEMISGQISDSVVWAKQGNDLWFWKIGESPRQIKIKEKYDGCSHEICSWRMREWKDGRIIILGETTVIDSSDSYRYIKNALVTLDSNKAYCQYGVLDTITQTIIYKRLDKDLEWMKKCDDVRAWGDDVYCFRPGEHPFEALLLRNGIDTIDIPIKFTVGDFWGDVLRPNANLCSLIDGKVVCSGAEWRGGLTFYENDEIVVNLE